MRQIFGTDVYDEIAILKGLGYRQGDHKEGATKEGVGRGQTPITRRPISIERLTVPSRMAESIFEFILRVLPSNGNASDWNVPLHRYRRETSKLRREVDRASRAAISNTWMNTRDERE